MATFRQAAWNLSPSRLRTYKAARMVYSFIGLPLDMIAQAAKEALQARFPELCGDDALAYHARDRGIRRGSLEPPESFRIRLLLWIASWRGAGVGRALLDQIAGFLTPFDVRIRLWTQVGVVYTREADGSFSIDRVAGWDWDGNATLWSRFWLIIYSVGGVDTDADGIDDSLAPFKLDGTWGDGSIWGDEANETWGSTATIEQVQTVRAIIDDWRPAASPCENIIIAYDLDLFDLITLDGVPDGTWEHWSKNVAGVQVPARDPRALYWDGVS